jgi:predicted amidophosphoribosyltransferase
VAAGAYAGPVRPALNAFKERGRAELAGPLGAALALAAAAVAAGVSGRPRPVVLVPVPSTPAALRTRGRDHVRELAGIAVAELRGAGVPATEARLLRRRGRVRVRDSAGLSAAQRRANLVGTFLPAPAGAWPPPGTLIVVVDDVVSSGATLTEAAAVLTAARRRGAPPVLAAAVAATPRQDDGRPSTGDVREAAGRHEVVPLRPLGRLSGPPARD